MQKLAPRRRLKPFREVTKHVGVRHQIRRLAESLNLPDAQNPKADLNYFALSIPMRFSDEEKQERLADMVDTISEIEGSDVILLAMWVSPTTE